MSTTVRDPKLWLPEDPFENEDGSPKVFREYLRELIKYPAWAEQEHSALRRLIEREGYEVDRSQTVQRRFGMEGLKAFKIFGDLFGMETSLYQIVNQYTHQGAEGGRASKMALAIVGPPGSGKSHTVNRLKAIMQKREPIPFLSGSPMWSNPLNLFMCVKLVAGEQSRHRRDGMIVAIERIVESLDILDYLDYSAYDFAQVATKYGFTNGQKLSPRDFANVCLDSEEDFARLFGYGLGLPVPSVETIGLPDPFVQDMVLGEFFGKAGVFSGKEMTDKAYGKYDPAYAYDIAEFPLDNMYMSKRQGMVDVSEVEPVNFELAVWRGKKDLANAARFKPRDPRTVNLSGAFNIGRFIVLTEGFRNPDEGFRILLESLEGNRIPLPEPLSNFHTNGVFWRGLVIVHSNDEQWNKFYMDPSHRAHLDRCSYLQFKYPTEWSEAQKVNEAQFRRTVFGRPVDLGGVHTDPLVMPIAAIFSTGTRIDWTSKGNRPFMAVLDAYNGKQVRDRTMGTEIDVRSLLSLAGEMEGTQGLSFRKVDEALGALAAQAKDLAKDGTRPSACIASNDLTRQFKLMIARDPEIRKMDKRMKDQWLSWLDSPIEDWRRIEASKRYKAAFIPNHQELCQTYARQYITYIECLKLNTSPNGVGVQPANKAQMMAFLSEVERANGLDINTAQAIEFRNEVYIAVGEYRKHHQGQDPSYTHHDGLREAIELLVLRKAQGIVGFTGMAGTLNDDQNKALSAAKAALLSTEGGYCVHCANRLINEVTTIQGFLR